MSARDSKADSIAIMPAARRNGATVLCFRELGILICVIAVVVIATAIEGRFIEPANLRNILRYIPLLLVVAMGQMMVIVSRNIDLSVGSTLGFSAIVVGNIFIHWPDFPLWAAGATAMLIGLLLGAFNGLLVAWLNIPAIIATLGTLNIYRGLVFIVSGGHQVDPNDIPVDLIRMSQTSIVPGVPWLVIFAAIIAALAYLFLTYTRTGREIYAIGSNPVAAALRGIPVRATTFLVFAVSGALAGLAGLMFASRFGYVNPGDTGVGFEVVVISAVILGGTNIFGGSGTVPGVALGCVLIGVIHIALAVLGISGLWQMAIYGAAILAAVSFDAELRRRAAKLRRRRQGV